MIDLLITFGMLLAAVVTIICSNRDNRKALNASTMLDFSKRYQDIALAMPDDGTLPEKYVKLYFDLCSEEYRLHKKKVVSNDTWELWVDGMKDCVNSNPRYREVWLANKQYYSSDDFADFFTSLFD